MDEHDLQVRVRAAWRFLEDGHKVKVEVPFRGRDASHPEVATLRASPTLPWSNALRRSRVERCSRSSPADARSTSRSSPGARRIRSTTQQTGSVLRFIGRALSNRSPLDGRDIDNCSGWDGGCVTLVATGHSTASLRISTAR
jgi:hypothetical protein